MLTSTTVDFFWALQIAAENDPRRRKWILFAGLLLNFYVLGAFKYFSFFSDSAVTALHSLGISGISPLMLQIVLPPSISFYKFQEVAYLVDVHNRKLEPAKSFVDYSLFISLFPHLIAGPIQRPSHLIPQVQNPRTCATQPFLTA